MKARLISDLHLESNKFYYEWMGEDVLFLLGDIDNSPNHINFLMTIPQHVKIIMIAGNHCFYHSDFDEVHKTLKSFEEFLPNYTYLNNESIDIGDISIFGGTMWTDFELYGHNDKPYVIQDATRGIADFKCITRNGRLWKVDDAIEQYNLFNREFDYWVKNSEGKTRVCLSHFLPSIKCVDKKFDGSSLNAYFASNQENRINLVDFYFNGHTHASYDFMFNDTRVVCNPYGYGKENSANFKNDLIIEIEQMYKTYEEWEEIGCFVKLGQSSYLKNIDGIPVFYINQVQQSIRHHGGFAVQLDAEYINPND